MQRAFILIRELDDQAQCEFSVPVPIYASAYERKANNTALVNYLRQYLQARNNHGHNERELVTTGSLSLSSPKGLISRVAAITEENSRAAQERVNIAQSVYDSVGPAILLRLSSY